MHRTVSRSTETATTVATSVLLTLVLLAPVAYMAYRAMPAAVATVDLQKLVEEQQHGSLQAVSGSSAGGGTLPDAQRKAAEQAAASFAARLSAAVDIVSNDCRCVLMNRAAVLGGTGVDLTDLVRARIGSPTLRGQQ